jgi:acyl-CoA reductase-like NAD-dependent aldehyde dehydrogenase
MADVPGAQSAFEWFARMAEERPDEEELAGSPFPVSENYLRYEPIGVCTGIIPWNFPLIMAAWKIAPAIAAGNTSVLKPASFTSLSALKLAEILQEADLPPGVVNVISGPGGSVGEELASSTLVDKTAFTGSTEVGRRIMQLASGNVKACTLELGGKSANIVLDDADLDTAAAGVLWGTFMHNGQVCESGTRALVQRGIYDVFVALVADRAGKIILGAPLDAGTDLGPLVPHGQVETVERYVAAGRDEVGEPITGGAKPEGLPDGLDINSYFQPTIFADVNNDAKIAQEEIFGPVLSVIPFDTEEEALAIANNSIYGLAGGVQSGNLERAKKVAAGMRTGTVWINDYHLISPERPFGGYKESGIGRELGVQGYEIYRQVKHVHVNPNADRENHFHYALLSGNI